MNNILVNTLFQWVLLIGIIYYTRKYSKIYVVPLLVITYLLFLYQYPDSQNKPHGFHSENIENAGVIFLFGILATPITFTLSVFGIYTSDYLYGN